MISGMAENVECLPGSCLGRLISYKPIVPGSSLWFSAAKVIGFSFGSDQGVVRWRGISSDLLPSAGNSRRRPDKRTSVVSSVSQSRGPAPKLGFRGDLAEMPLPIT